MANAEIDRLASLWATPGKPLPNLGAGATAPTVSWNKGLDGILRFTAAYADGATATGVAGHGGFHVLETTQGGGSVVPSGPPAIAPDVDAKRKPPVPEPPQEPGEEDEEEDDKQPFEPNAPTVPPPARPPDLQRLLEPNPWDGRPDSGVKLSTAPRAYGQAVPGHPSTFGRPADTTTREDGRNDLPPFPFGPDVPVEWPPHTPPVGQRGPLGDVGIDIGWGTQGGAGWQESGQRTTGWSRRNMTRVPSAYKALHQVGRRPLY